MQPVLVLVLVACCAKAVPPPAADRPPASHQHVDAAVDRMAPLHEHIDAVAARMHLSPDQVASLHRIADVSAQTRAKVPDGAKATKLFTLA